MACSDLRFIARSNRRGGAMVELVVVLPILVLLAIGVMDFGRVFFTSISVANAARAGAEWGAFDVARTVQTTNMQDFAKADGADAGTMTVTSNVVCRCAATVVACSSVCGGYGDARVFVEVTASKPVNFFLNYPGIPSSITVSRTATFRAK